MTLSDEEQNELDNWATKLDARRHIEWFMEWLATRGVGLSFRCASPDTPLTLCGLLDEYHEVNRTMLDQARQALLDEQRELNRKR